MMPASSTNYAQYNAFFVTVDLDKTNITIWLLASCRHVCLARG